MFKNALGAAITLNLATPLLLSTLLGFKLEDTSKQGGGFGVYLENVLKEPGSHVDIEVDDASYTDGASFMRTLVFEQGIDAKHLVGPFDVAVGTTPGAHDLAPLQQQIAATAPFATLRHNSNVKPAATEIKHGRRTVIRVTKNAHAAPDSNSLRFFVQ